MRVLICFVALAVATSVFSHASAFLSQDQKDEIVLLHNQARSSVTPTAQDMMIKMEWDSGLEASAQQWAQTCPQGHSPNTAVGENIG